ncbi:MAG: M3 family metallopeptidase [Oscillospiraceae bacterium]
MPGGGLHPGLPRRHRRILPDGAAGYPAPAGGQPGQPVPGRRHCRKSLCHSSGPGLRPPAAPPADPGPPNSRRGQGPAGPHLPADGPVSAADGLRQISGPWELLSGGQLRAALASRDRARRKAAYDAQQQTVLENAGQLEDILRQLVHARIDLARANGFDSFADYGDLAQQRLGYGRAELDAFCRQVRTHITPLYLRLQEEQRQRLGVEALLPYDRALVFPEGNAVPVAAEELPGPPTGCITALAPGRCVFRRDGPPRPAGRDWLSQ